MCTHGSPDQVLIVTLVDAARQRPSVAVLAYEQAVHEIRPRCMAVPDSDLHGTAVDHKTHARRIGSHTSKREWVMVRNITIPIGRGKLDNRVHLAGSCLQPHLEGAVCGGCIGVYDTRNLTQHTLMPSVWVPPRPLACALRYPFKKASNTALDPVTLDSAERRYASQGGHGRSGAVLNLIITAAEGGR